MRGYNGRWLLPACLEGLVMSQVAPPGSKQVSVTSMKPPESVGRGAYMALTAALLGWMFDGFEMGIFSQVGRPAIQDLLQTTDEGIVGLWFNVVIACFLVGAATGGVVFGWLGDRIGRVRAMTLSVFTYAVFTGLCGLAADVTVGGVLIPGALQLGLLRFIASIGMGGEWSLGVALVMEVWPNRSRAFMAGLIGAAANVGYLLVGFTGIWLNAIITDLAVMLTNIGVSDSLVATLTANQGWRIMLLMGTLPALLTFLIRIFVPESEKWEHEKEHGRTSHWQAVDLIGVMIGCLGPFLIVYMWAFPSSGSFEHSTVLRVIATLIGLAIATVGFTYPVIRYLQRLDISSGGNASGASWQPTLRRMLLAAGLSGVALLGTWGSTQQAPSYAGRLVDEQFAREAAVQLSGFGSGDNDAAVEDALAKKLVKPADRAKLATLLKASTVDDAAVEATLVTKDSPLTAAALQPIVARLQDDATRAELVGTLSQKINAKENMQIWLAIGAIVGTIAAAFFGDLVGRRNAYCLLCVLSLGSTWLLYILNDHYSNLFLFTGFLAGAATASFYGWLPLYLPELFRTNVRATGQGFGFNFGRVLAAIGALQTGTLMGQFTSDLSIGGITVPHGHPAACSTISLIYVVGMVLIWFAPETKGKPLPE